MSFFVVQKSEPLRGSVKISGAKNAVLPILCACLLSDEECFVEIVAQLRDVFVLIDIVKIIGA